jgi:putative PIG3 family NAD(P)H quinone oxidoreductase
MRAIVITAPGGPDVLQERSVAAPDPGPSHIRVRVAASAVNRADLMQRQGRYPAPPGSPQDVPGLEYAGTVDAVGSGVTMWRAGDRVMGLVGGGGYSEMVVVHEAEAMRVPVGLTFEEAAAIPEVFITAHDALVTQMRIAAGERLLIHGVGSGVGTAGLQLAIARDVTVYGTARTPWKLERALSMGLARAIDSTVDDFVEILAAETDGKGVDGVLDLVGGDFLAGNVSSLATHGRLVIVGVVAGATSTLDMRALMQRRASIRGTVLRARPLEDKIAATKAFADDALPLFERGELRPVIDRVIAMTDAAEAHRVVQSNETFGKVVLRW